MLILVLSDNVLASPLEVKGNVKSINVAGCNGQWAALGIARGKVELNGFKPAGAGEDILHLFVFIKGGQAHISLTLPLSKHVSGTIPADVQVNAASIHPSGVLAVVGSYWGKIDPGSRILPDTQNRDGFVILIDLATQSTKSVVFKTAHTEELSAISATSEGFVVAGYGGGDGVFANTTIGPLTNSPVAGLVGAIDLDGKHLWHHRIEAALLDSVSTNSQGMSIVSGWAATSITVGLHRINVRGHASTFAAAFNANGEVQWAVSLGGRSDCSEFITRTLVLEDGGALTAGLYCGEDAYPGDDLPHGYLSSYLARLDSNGEVRWIRRLFRGSSSTASQIHHVTGLIRLPDNRVGLSAVLGPGVLIGRSKVHDGSDLDAVLIVGDLDGQILGTKNFGSAGADRPVGASLTTEGGELSLLIATSGEINQLHRIPAHLYFGDSPIDLGENRLVDGNSFDRMLNFADGRIHVDAGEGINTTHAAVLQFRGFGLSHALISLARLTPQLTIEKSVGMYAINETEGLEASAGMSLSGNVAADWERYTKGLSLRLGAVPEASAQRWLEGGDDALIINLSPSQHQNLKLALEKAAMDVTEPLIAFDDVKEKRRFYGAVHASIKAILGNIGLNYSPDLRYNLPQQVFEMIAYQRDSQPSTSIALGLKHFDRTVTADANYQGDVQDGKPHGKGTVSFNERLVIYPNGKRYRWTHYQGKFVEGRFEGEGKLVYHPDDNERRHRMPCVRFEGIFQEGLPEGDGELRSCDGKLQYAEGSFIGGEFRDGTLREFNSKGELVMLSEWRSGRRHGRLEIHEPAHESLRQLTHYRAGLKHGQEFIYYPVSRAIRRMQTFEDGQPVGKVRHFFYDGMVKYDNEGGYIDVRLPTNKTVEPDGSWVFSGYERFDRYGRGHLSYVYDGELVEPTYDEVQENGIPVRKQYDYANGDALVVEGEDATYYWKDQSMLIGNYGLVPNRIQFNERYHGLIKHRWLRTPTEFYGPYLLIDNKGGTLSGTIKNAKIDGPAIYHTPKGDTQSVTVTNGSWTWNWEEQIRLKKAGPLRRLGKELERWWDDAWHNIDEGFGEIHKGICKLVGKEEDDPSCSTCAGAQCDTDGNCAAMDCNGVISDVPTLTRGEIPPLTAFEVEPMTDGIWRLISSVDAKLGLPWPGMIAGESVYLPGNGKVRAFHTKYGYGTFWTSRDGGTRSHVGFDAALTPGTEVLAPVTGWIEKVSNVYLKKNQGLRAIVIRNGGHEAKVLYVKPHFYIGSGSFVVAGKTSLGFSQSLSSKYPGIPEHVHIQIQSPDGGYYPPTGKLPRQLPLLRRR